MSAIFLKILNMSAAASWVAAAILLLRSCLKRAPKWVNVLLWGFVAVRLLLPFSIESMLSLLPRTEVIRPAVTNVPVQTAAAPAIGTTAAAASGAAASPLSIWTILAWVWLAGAAILLLYGAVSSLCLHRRVREAVRLRGNIYQSERIGSPFVLGTICPKIYLPYHMDSCGWQYVIAHEQAHLRRGDHLWKPLGFLLLTIHWFNPLMWLSYVLLCRDIELACDEKVIQDLECGQRADYMQALVSCSVSRRRIAACPLAFGEIGVKERVKSVMNYKKPTLWVTLLAAALCVVLAGCFLTDPADSKTEKPADAVVSSTEPASDPTDTTPEQILPNAADTAPEAPAQPAAPSESEQAPEQPTESEATKDMLAAAEADKQKLDAAISKAILDYHADIAQDGQIHVESHVILQKDGFGAEKITVYLLVLQEAYSVDGETLTEESGSYVPTAITFAVSASGEYTLEEYWEPSDGSYSDDIRAKFPADTADEALNDQAYIDDLKAACDQKALDAMNGAAN